MRVMLNGRVRRTEAEWRALITKNESSGLSAAGWWTQKAVNSPLVNSPGMMRSRPRRSLFLRIVGAVPIRSVRVPGTRIFVSIRRSPLRRSRSRIRRWKARTWQTTTMSARR